MKICLNEYQKQAVEDESDACIVNANVGSGKTTVLIAKVLYLHTQKQVPYEDMVVLTFTNKAADEIRERLMEQEPKLDKEELAGFGTFHGVALKLLKSRLPLETYGWRKDFLIMDPDEELDLAQTLIAEKKRKIKYKNRLKKRMEQEYPLYLKGNPESRYQDDLYLLFQDLEEEKKRLNKMSFQDLITISTELLKKAPQKPAWIIIDEVQDSDKAQVEFIRALKGAETRLFAVGDPNQVIYSWRGSMETMFYYLKHEFQAKELSLPVNYRSKGVILEAAKRFLQNGNGIAGSREMGNRIVLKNHYDPFQEALYLAQKIKNLAEEGLPYGEIAVFYRLQSQSEILTKVGEKEGIPFAVSVKKTVKDIPVLDWLLNLLRFAVNPTDWVSGAAVLCNPVYGEGLTRKKALALLKEQKREASLFMEKALGFSRHFENAGMPEPLVLYDYFSLDCALKPNSASYTEEKGLVLQFLGRLVDYLAQHGNTFLNGTREFLTSSALYGLPLEQDEASPDGSVRLMTLHASKGLEFSYVFIIGVNHGLIPLWESGMDEEEERRLFFVGMTRAKDNLELSYYTNPGRAKVQGGPGRYLKMIPEHLIDRQDIPGEEERRANLQDLRKAVLEERKKTREPEPIRVKHPKYGEGVFIEEDELTVTAEFENYGRKQFLKAFGELEILGKG